MFESTSRKGLLSSITKSFISKVREKASPEPTLKLDSLLLVVMNDKSRLIDFLIFMYKPYKTDPCILGNSDAFTIIHMFDYTTDL